MSAKKSQDDRITSVREALGANDAMSVQQLVLYIPDKDRDDNQIEDVDAWRNQAMELLSKIGGGASAYHGVVGAWLNPETQRLIRENTTVVLTYVLPENFEAMLPELRAFLHEFGKTTNQGEVLVHFDGAAYRIDIYDPE